MAKYSIIYKYEKEHGASAKTKNKRYQKYISRERKMLKQHIHTKVKGIPTTKNNHL
jgi:hypothetical protein